SAEMQPQTCHNNPDNNSWPEYFPDCAGTSQSPVDVVTTQTKYDPSLGPVTPLGYDQHNNRPFTLYNNGHTGNYSTPCGGGAALSVQLHLHWGSGGPGRGGSEHTINGLSADAELHVVHYNSELYPNMSAAVTQPDGLAVLGILIVVKQQLHKDVNKQTNKLFCFSDQKTLIPAFDVQSLLPKDLRRYYRYNGSLTTPPCHQSVTWTLFRERVQISKAQVRRISDDDGKMLQDNYRAIQPLHHRVVLTSFSAGQIDTKKRKC
uniref:carbonic anhydrase n=1 Tax=Cynoglossus semilaevis TaxID=244447 RepID=A0A3P8UPQ3_CYNSE